jgi:tripartite-type tricarboxylate transporter receptor subunit TctC
MPARLSRRRALLALGAIGAPTIVPFTAIAQGVPDKPVSILVGFTTGGGLDYLARSVAPRLESRIGRHVRIENHPGANGLPIVDSLKKGRQGSTLLACIPQSTIEAYVTSPNGPTGPGADPTTGMSPLCLAGTFPMTLAVSPKVEVDSFSQFVEWLTAEDTGRRRIGMAAADAYLDFYTLLLGKAFGTTLQGVSYRGERPLMNDLQDNRLPAAIADLPSAIESHRGGKAKILITSADKRLPRLPKLPTAFEYGRPSLTTTAWYGIFTSPGTPEPLADLWNMHLRAVLAEPELASQLTNIGVGIQPSDPTELGQRVVETMKDARLKMLALGMQPSR